MSNHLGYIELSAKNVHEACRKKLQAIAEKKKQNSEDLLEFAKKHGQPSRFQQIFFRRKLLVTREDFVEWLRYNENDFFGGSKWYWDVEYVSDVEADLVRIMRSASLAIKENVETILIDIKMSNKFDEEM